MVIFKTKKGMAVLIFLVTLLDAIILPTSGLLPKVVFILMVGMGLWRVTSYRRWYILSLVYITLATLGYLFGITLIAETVVHKLSDWSLIFLLLGTVQLARLVRTKYESKNN